MANTYTQIGNTVTVGSNSPSTVSFNSIPATYTDLKVVISTRASAYSIYTNQLFCRFNGSTSGYSSRNIGIATATVPSSGSNPYSVTNYLYCGEQPTTALTASTFTNNEMYIPNYAGSQYKTVKAENISENNSSTDYTYQVSLLNGLWSDTAAISSITFYAKYDFTGTFEQYSTFTLYGIKNS
jgi:hypothetical protein